VVVVDAKSGLSNDSLQACLDALRKGELILYPTETFYAIGIDPWNDQGRKRIYEAKGRGASKELPCIASDPQMVENFCDVKHPAYKKLSAHFWPGPLTMVLPLHEGNASIAIRVSLHPVARQIARGFRSPVVSTSANRSGEAPLNDLKSIPWDLREAIAIAVDAGPARGGLPSTIVSLLEGVPKIIRQGAIASEKILALI
jgi:L-threonylcarbamoyladenylate synthase